MRLTLTSLPVVKHQPHHPHQAQSHKQSGVWHDSSNLTKGFQPSSPGEKKMEENEYQPQLRSITLPRRGIESRNCTGNSKGVNISSWPSF